jgi:hypothetical protein
MAYPSRRAPPQRLHSMSRTRTPPAFLYGCSHRVRLLYLTAIRFESIPSGISGNGR